MPYAQWSLPLGEVVCCLREGRQSSLIFGNYVNSTPQPSTEKSGAAAHWKAYYIFGAILSLLKLLWAKKSLGKSVTFPETEAHSTLLILNLSSISRTIARIPLESQRHQTHLRKQKLIQPWCYQKPFTIMNGKPDPKRINTVLVVAFQNFAVKSCWQPRMNLTCVHRI